MGYLMDKGKLIAIVETASYLKRADALFSEAERLEIVEMLARDPSAGDLMPGAGGLRKLRVALAGRGKRGGGRLITFFHDLGMPLFILDVYAKNARVDLDPGQRKAAMALTEAIKSQYGR